MLHPPPSLFEPICSQGPPPLWAGEGGATKASPRPYRAPPARRAAASGVSSISLAWIVFCRCADGRYPGDFDRSGGWSDRLMEMLKLYWKYNICI